MFFHFQGLTRNPIESTTEPLPFSLETTLTLGPKTSANLQDMIVLVMPFVVYIPWCLDFQCCAWNADSHAVFPEDEHRSKSQKTCPAAATCRKTVFQQRDPNSSHVFLLPSSRRSLGGSPSCKTHIHNMLQGRWRRLPFAWFLAATGEDIRKSAEESTQVKASCLFR